MLVMTTTYILMHADILQAKLVVSIPDFASLATPAV